jgi:PAS domain S-box-containing protein
MALTIMRAMNFIYECFTFHYCPPHMILTAADFNKNPAPPLHYFLEGGGEMGALMRAKDWSNTPLGDPATWPESLCTMVAVMLANPFGMYIAWGKDYVQLYNDGYRPILGATKHPQALGNHSKDTFAEIWHIIGPMFDDVMEGKAVSFVDFTLQLNRNGYDEDCCFDFAYSPIRTSDGQVGGLLVTVMETTAKKRAEDMLRESNNRFRSIVRQAPVAMTILRGPHFMVEMANDAYLNLVNKAENDFVGKPLFESLPEAKESVASILDEVMRSGAPYHGLELAVPLNRHGKEETMYFDFIYHPLYEAGVVSGVIAVASDVSEKVEIRKKIEERKRLYETITQNTPDLIYVFDLNYRFSYINEALLKMWGRSWDDSIGKSLLEIGYEPWHAEMHEREIDEIVLSKTPIRGEVSFPHATLGKRIYDYILVPVIDQDGNVEAVAGTTRDITQQVEQRRQLEESRELFSNFGNNIQNLAWIADGVGNRFWYNQRWLDYTGFTLEEMKGDGWHKVHHPDHIGRLLEKGDALWSTNEPFEYTLPLRRHDGAYRWFLSRFVPIADEQGNIYRWIGTNTDITAQKATQDLLTESENRYRSLVDNIPMISFIVEPVPSGSISFWNKTWLDYTGLSYQDALDNNWACIVHPNDVDMFFQIYREAFASRKSFYIPAARVKRHDGVYRWHLFTANPRYLQNGEFMGYIGVGLDIHDQKIADEILKESEERFRSLAQTLPQLVWVADAHGKAEFVSTRWQDYAGVDPRGEIEMKSIVHPSDYEGSRAAWIDSLKTGEGYAYEVRLKSKEGCYRWFTVKGEPVHDKEGNIVKWVGAYTDIHEQKVKEEKKDEFISIASHELKTPLTSAKAYLQMLELTLDEANHEAILYSKKASHAVERLNSLIGELLDVSKIRLGKLNYNISSFDFNALVEDTVENIQLTSPSHQIVQTGRVNNPVTGDKDRLQQVLINLLTNAIKYSPDADKVYVHAEQNQDCVKVTVKDTGIGIAQQNLDRIFEKYQRVEEHAVQFQGLGIGLFISFEIIQRHNGNLWAESEPGKGSIFNFTLPTKSSLTP